MTDTYSWIGSSGGLWDAASDWTDLVTHTSLTVGWPTTTASAIVIGPQSGTYEVISGPGSAATLATTGSIALSGSFSITGTLTAGDNQSKDTIGASLQVENSSTINTATLLLNSGTIDVSGTGARLIATTETIGQPTGYVIPSGSFFQWGSGVAGTLDIESTASMTASGTVAVINGSLLANGTETFGGLLLGIALSNANTTGAYYYQTDGHLVIASGSAAIAGNATVVAGEIAVNGGSLSVGGTVALQGQAIDGGGLYVDESGTAEIAALTIAPTGQATGGQAVVAVDSTSALGIGPTGPVQAGTLAIAAGTDIPVGYSAVIQASAIINSGTIVLSAGTLSMQGPLAGSGTIEVAPRSLLQLEDPVTSGTIAMTGTGGTVEIAAAVGIPISNFSVGDTLVFDQTTATALSFNAGELSVLNGTSVAAAIALGGVFPGATFSIVETQAGQAIVTMLTQGAPGPSPNTDAYAWTGSASGGAWSSPANWTDRATGTASIYYLPGTLTPVIIAGTANNTPEIVNGGGSAASLSITAQVELAGTYTIDGMLSVGTTSQTGTMTLGTAASVIASGLSLGAGSLLQVATNASVGIGATGPVANGTLAIAAQTAITASGTLVAPVIANLGTIIVPTGSLDIAGSLAGTGTIVVDGGATAVLGSDKGTILLAGTNSALEITAGSSLSGTIYGYAPGEAIVFDGITASAAMITASDMLVLSHGTTTVATIALAGTYTQPSLSLATTPSGGTSVTLLDNPPPGTSQWTGTTPGDFANAADWTGQQVPGSALKALIDSPSQPTVIYDTGSDTLQALTNALGNFSMIGGTLAAGTLTNDSLMNWSGGTLTATAFANAGALLVVANGQTLTGSALTNTGGIVVAGGSGSATISDSVGNSGSINVAQGTLCLAGGGTSSGAGLSGAGTLDFTGGTFTVSNGDFLPTNLAVAGGVLELASPTQASTIALTSGTLVSAAPLWANNFTQAGGTLIGALIAANATLTGGSETAPGLSTLTGNSRISGTIAIAGGHTLANTNTLTWSAGGIDLNNGTLTNAGQFTILAANQIEGSGGLVNTGTAIVASTGDVRIDATLTNSGTIVLQSGTLSVGGGTMYGQLHAAAGTMLQLDAAAEPFTVSSASYSAANAWVNGGTLNLSATDSIAFVQSLTTSAGLLALGSLAAADDGSLIQSGGTISGSGTMTVEGNATISGGAETGSGVTALRGDSTLAGLTLSGGRILDSSGELDWTQGNIVLSTGTIRNDGAGLITASGTIQGTGSVLNNGRITASGDATIDVPLANSGSIQVMSGTFSLNGGGSSAAGALSESSTATIDFGGGTFAITGTGFTASNLALTGGTLQLSNATATNLALQGGTLAESGTMTVSGTADLGVGLITGPGTIQIAGTGRIGNFLTIGGTLDNRGLATWNSGTVSLLSGATFRNDASLDIYGNSTIQATGSAEFVNAGNILVSSGAGIAAMNAKLINTGTILVANGTLALAQTVSGTGTIILNGPAMISLAGSVAGTEHLRFLAPGGTLATSETGLLAAQIAGFGVSDTLDVTAIGYSAGDAITFRNGMLILTGIAASAEFILSGTYARPDFHILDDNHGGTAIVYVPT